MAIDEQVGAVLATGPEFRWRDDWYFARVIAFGEHLGAVRLRHKVRVGFWIEALIPPAEWASIVAAVTPEGDNATTYRVATGLHG